jgi:hypothetical protein
MTPMLLILQIGCVLPGPRPPALQEPRVLVSDGTLRKSVVALDPRIGYIRGIEPLPRQGRIAVFGACSLWYVLPSGVVEPVTRGYCHGGARPALIDVANAGSWAIACRGRGFSGILISP